jgi:hypothetical protein
MDCLAMVGVRVKPDLYPLVHNGPCFGSANVTLLLHSHTLMPMIPWDTLYSNFALISNELHSDYALLNIYYAYNLTLITFLNFALFRFIPFANGMQLWVGF